MAEKGIGPLSYGEYTTETFLPIPMEDAIKEVWKEQGIASNKAEDYLKALEAGAAGMLGVNIRDIPPPKPAKAAKPEKSILEQLKSNNRPTRSSADKTILETLQPKAPKRRSSN